MTGNDVANPQAAAIAELSERRRLLACLETTRERFVAQLRIAVAMLDPDQLRDSNRCVGFLTHESPTRCAIETSLEGFAETAQRIEKLDTRPLGLGATA